MLKFKNIVAGITVCLAATGVLSLPTYATNTYGNMSGIDTNILNTWMQNTDGFSDLNFFDCTVAAVMLENNLLDTEMIAHVESNSNVLSTADLESITSLSCNSQGIYNANGIEKMPNLTFLSLDGNSDLHGINIGNNFPLQTLSILNTSITNVDASNNSNLSTLRADGVNFLTPRRVEEVFTNPNGEAYVFAFRALLNGQLDAAGFWTPVASTEYDIFYGTGNYIAGDYYFESAHGFYVLSTTNRPAPETKFTLSDGAGHTITIQSKPLIISVRWTVINQDDQIIGDEGYGIYDQLYSNEVLDSDNYLNNILGDNQELLSIEAYISAYGYMMPLDYLAMFPGSTTTRLVGTVWQGGHPDGITLHYLIRQNSAAQTDPTNPNAPTDPSNPIDPNNPANPSADVAGGTTADSSDSPVAPDTGLITTSADGTEMNSIYGLIAAIITTLAATTAVFLISRKISTSRRINF